MKIKSQSIKWYSSLVALAFIVSVIMFTNNNKESKLEAATESNVYAIETVTAVSDKAANFTFKKGGKTMTFQELTKGKIVFLNFWGTWCPPCKRELPDIVKISKEMSDKVIVIGIALERGDDVSENVSKVATFAKANGLDYYNFVDGKRELAKVYGGIRAVPTTFIIDKSGKIALAHEGMDSYDGFKEKINKVIASK